MSRDDPRVRFQHMLEYAREAVALMENRTRADLDRDRALGLAIIRCVEIIGEAASRVSHSVQNSYPNIPWPEIISMRNRLIHGYDLVDYEIVWSTVRDDLPPLISELEKLI